MNRQVAKHAKKAAKKTTKTKEQPPLGPGKLSELAPAPWNPRTISPEAARALSESLTIFGDLSGFVFNARTGHVVCGRSTPHCPGIRS